MEQGIDILETGRHARKRVLLLGELGDFLERFGEQGVHLREVGRDALLGDVEQDLLGFFDNGGQVIWRIVRERIDLR